MKIVKGILRGRNFACPPETRPVLESVRKSCFDILKDVVAGANCLDLFAGTGALGLEALSLSAANVDFVDYRQSCVAAISESLRKFNLQGQAICEDAFEVISDYYRAKRQFDLIFLDPPYYQANLKKALCILREYDILTRFGYWVCFCYLKDEILENTEYFTPVSDKKYGQTRLIIYKKTI